MSERPISPLRQRMQEDLTVRRISEKTRSNYIRHVATFTAFLDRSPDTATAEDVRRFQVHLTGTGVGPSSMNQAATALRFFFAVTLGRSDLALHLARVHYPRKLPRVLSPEEGLRLVSDTPGAECFLVAADGRQFRSLGWRTLELALPAQDKQEKVDTAWPEGYQTTITVTLPTPGRRASSLTRLIVA